LKNGNKVEHICTQEDGTRCVNFINRNKGYKSAFDKIKTLVYKAQSKAMASIIDILVRRYYKVLLANHGKGQFIDKEYHDNLIGNMLHALDTNSKVWPEDKLNRWLGFVQGVLYAEGLITIENERNFLRPLFHQYYKTKNPS